MEEVIKDIKNDGTARIILTDPTDKECEVNEVNKIEINIYR